MVHEVRLWARKSHLSHPETETRADPRGATVCRRLLQRRSLLSWDPMRVKTSPDSHIPAAAHGVVVYGVIKPSNSSFR